MLGKVNEAFLAVNIRDPFNLPSVGLADALLFLL